MTVSNGRATLLERLLLLPPKGRGRVRLRDASSVGHQLHRGRLQVSRGAKRTVSRDMTECHVRPPIVVHTASNQLLRRPDVVLPPAWSRGTKACILLQSLSCPAELQAVRQSGGG